MIFISVRPHPGIDMPNKYAFAREEFITSSSLSVLNEEVLLAAGVPVGPESMNFKSDFDILEGQLMVSGFYYGLNPALVRLAPYRASAMSILRSSQVTYMQKDAQVDHRHRPSCQSSSNTSFLYLPRSNRYRRDPASRRLLFFKLTKLRECGVYIPRCPISCAHTPHLASAGTVIKLKILTSMFIVSQCKNRLYLR